MSAPATVLVLDAAQAGPQAQKFVASPDRLVVATDSPALARHALSTMAVTVWICDLSAQADDKIAQIAMDMSWNFFMTINRKHYPKRSGSSCREP